MSEDPGTIQWREMFAAQMTAEFKRNREMLDEIRLAVRTQNNDIRANQLAIAALKVWVPIVGGGTLAGSIIATAVIQLLTR